MSLKLASRQSTALTLKHEINVTPFIDVMLVLLIIFMVAAPLATRQMPVDLPSLSSGAQTPEQPITLWITESGLWYINDTLVEKDQVIPRIDAIRAQAASTQNADESTSQPNTRLQIRADKTLSYEQVMGAMNMLSAAGYTQIGLIGVEGGASPSIPPKTQASAELAADSLNQTSAASGSEGI